MDSQRRKLLFRASHRGIREMDIILSRYAAQSLPDMSDQEVLTFSEMLRIDDQSFYQALSEERFPKDQFAAIALQTQAPVGDLLNLLEDIWHWMRKHPYRGEA